MKEEMKTLKWGFAVRYLILMVIIILFLVYTVFQWFYYWVGLILILLIFWLNIAIVDQNTTRLVTFLWKYEWYISTPWVHILPPFYSDNLIVQIKLFSSESQTLKVNDKWWNPILISWIVNWKINDAYKAIFNVDNYKKFLENQIDICIRKIASDYHYDNQDKDNIALTSGQEEINVKLKNEINNKVWEIWINIIDAKINHLSYAPEIAQVMLKRQQANATIQARTKIVDWAVSMVEMALMKLSEQKMVDLNNEDKAKMTINLLTVLCSDNVQPTIQTNNN